MTISEGTFGILDLVTTLPGSPSDGQIACYDTALFDHRLLFVVPVRVS